MRISWVLTPLMSAVFAALITVATESTIARQQDRISFLDLGHNRPNHYPGAAGHPHYPPGSMHASGPPIHYTTISDPSAGISMPDVSSNKVIIAGLQFLPATIRVKAGETVTWINYGPMVHTLTSQNNGLLASQPLSRGSMFSHVFKKPGVFHYYCLVHPSNNGLVVVN